MRVSAVRRRRCKGCLLDRDNDRALIDVRQWRRIRSSQPEFFENFAEYVIVFATDGPGRRYPSIRAGAGATGSGAGSVRSGRSMIVRETTNVIGIAAAAAISGAYLLLRWSTSTSR